MKRGIFGRILVLYAVVLLAGLLLSEVYITTVVRESHVSALERSLRAQASLIAEHLSPDAGMAEMERMAGDLKGKTGARVTIIAEDGTVLGDSDEDAAKMENHAERPEIGRARFGGHGSSMRHSRTIGTDFLYTAVTVTREGGIAGYVRLAVPLVEVRASVNRLRFQLFLVVLLVLAATGAFHAWQTGRLRRLTREVVEFSDAIVRGDFGRRLFFEGMGEFSEIARNLNVMAEELKESVAVADEEKDRLNVILRSVPDALLIIDPKDVIVLTSAASRSLFGDLPLRGRSYAEVVRSHEFVELVEEVRDTRRPAEREIRLDRPEERDLEVRVSPLFYRETELSGVLAIFHDITRLKGLERIRREFVANVSHEIRTPVSSIKGYAETLLDGALEEKDNARKFLETIRANSERLNSLVDDLLTISRLEIGALRVEKEAVDVGGAVEEVTALLGGKAEGKGLALTTALDPEAREIMADRGRLIQVLTNLVDNAIKFTLAGGVTVRSAKEEGRVVLSVEDTGIGVSRKHLPRLGERFFRVDPSRSRALGGTGLGLAIVKHIVKAHGWEMRIESAEGRGTAVRIIIPRRN